MTTGQYAYLCDGAETPIREDFTVDERWGIVTVTSSRSAPGTSLTVVASYTPDGGQSAAVAWRSDLAGTVPVADVDLTLLADGRVVVSGEVAGAAVDDEVTVGADGSLFPLMRVFSGRTLLRLATAGDAGLEVCVPDIRDPRDRAAFLRPLVDRRRVGSVRDDSLEVDGRSVPCRVVEYLGGSYDQAAEVWVDEGGLLLRYTWDQPGVGDWDVRLCEVTGEWPRPARWGG